MKGKEAPLTEVMKGLAPLIDSFSSAEERHRKQLMEEMTAMRTVIRRLPTASNNISMPPPETIDAQDKKQFSRMTSFFEDGFGDVSIIDINATEEIRAGFENQERLTITYQYETKYKRVVDITVDLKHIRLNAWENDKKGKKESKNIETHFIGLDAILTDRELAQETVAYAQYLLEQEILTVSGNHPKDSGKLTSLT